MILDWMQSKENIRKVPIAKKGTNGAAILVKCGNDETCGGKTLSYDPAYIGLQRDTVGSRLTLWSINLTSKKSIEDLKMLKGLRN